MRIRWAAIVVWLAGAAPALASPLDLPCAAPDAGRVYCATDGAGTRVPSFDGTPLDVDVTSPAGAGVTPLVVIRHAYGGTRSGADSADVRWFVDRGYRVLTYAARAHGRSGDVAHWDDPRYEPRDTQTLVGRLVDEGLVDPDGIAVMGTSYGAGQAATLAALDDRVVLADGTVVPWTSPDGVPLHIAAAVPVLGWTDLADALAPDGHDLDYAELPATRPAGVPLDSWNALLDAPGIALDEATHALFTTWATGSVRADDPDALAAAAAARATHSATVLYDGHKPAPTLFSQGWDDELFPLSQVSRAFAYYRSVGAPVRIALADTGHGRAQDKADANDFLAAEGRAWIEHFARGEGPAPAVAVTYRTMTCPAAAASGPVAGLPSPLGTPGEVRLGEASGGFDDQGGDQEEDYDPFFGRPFCERRANVSDGGDAVVLRGDPARGDGYTLVGAPAVSGDFRVAGDGAQVAARLFDESDAGHVLVARGVWRPVAGHGVFQLHANGWRFAPGHRPVLQLLGADRGYVRASPDPFRVDVDRLAVRLPVAETIGSADGQVTRPLPYDLPAGYVLSAAGAAREAGLAALPVLPPPSPTPDPSPRSTPAATPSPSATPSPTATPRPSARAVFTVRRAGPARARRQAYVLRLTSPAAIASVAFRGPGVRATDRRGPFRVTVRVPRGRHLRRIRFTAVVRLQDGRRVEISRRARLPGRRG